MSSWTILLTRVKVIPKSVRREIYLSRRLTRFHDRCSHQVRAYQELCVSNCVFIGILVKRKFKEQRSPNSSKTSVAHKEEVKVLQQGVSEFETSLSSSQDCIPKCIRLLRPRTLIVMTAREGIESTQLVPPGTEFLIGVSSESANVGTYHLKTKHLTDQVVSNRSL